MNQVFIVRPFGTTNGIDFHRVEAELIQPAIAAVGFTGGTTGEIVKPGNIRTDMFQKLLVADLVIADVSMHNANAFYELGVRHAFREKRTFLLRRSKDGLPPDAKLDEVPFDLKTDRYLEYRLDALAAARHAHRRAAEHHRIAGSRQPDLPAAAQAGGGGCRNLPQPADGFPRGGRTRRGGESGGRPQSAVERSRAVWEPLRERLPFDREANLLLGTIIVDAALALPTWPARATASR